MIKLSFIGIALAQAILCFSNTTGVKSPSSITTSNDLLKTDWNDVSNVASSDDNYASVAFLVAGVSENIYVSDFDLDVPALSIISGVKVQFEGYKTSGSISSKLSITKDGNSSIGLSNRNNSWPSAESLISHGNASDLWGATLSAAEINSPSFGILFETSGSGGFGVVARARVDMISIEVNYIEALPVTFLSFHSKKEENGVELAWQTGKEVNNNYFEIQRSPDGHVWESISEVEGVGNSSVKVDYHFVDDNPLKGMNYYRLNQVDFDGQNSYSGVVASTFTKPMEITLYPNPATDYLFVEGHTEHLKVYCMQGTSQNNVQVVEQLENYSVLDISTLEKGNYILKSGDQSITFQTY